MSEPINVGDLAVIVKPLPCGCSASLGLIFLVERIERCETYGYCVYCKQKTFPAGVCVVAHGDFYTEVSRVKRIPPLDELESAKQKEDLREPA